MALDRPACAKCGNKNPKTIVLRRVVAANGQNMPFWYCAVCHSHAQPGRWLAPSSVDEYLEHWEKRTDDVPILDDYRGTEQCAVCGSFDVEFHHWMPQTLWNHADIEAQWPLWSLLGTYLCRLHHDIWHNTVTPWMPGRNGKA